MEEEAENRMEGRDLRGVQMEGEIGRYWRWKKQRRRQMKRREEEDERRGEERESKEEAIQRENRENEDGDGRAEEEQ